MFFVSILMYHAPFAWYCINKTWMSTKAHQSCWWQDGRNNATETTKSKVVFVHLCCWSVAIARKCMPYDTMIKCYERVNAQFCLGEFNSVDIVIWFFCITWIVLMILHSKVKRRRIRHKAQTLHQSTSSALSWKTMLMLEKNSFQNRRPTVPFSTKRKHK